MNGTLIASTSRGSMHPLAYQGIFSTDCHHQLVSILRSRLGDTHVLLFAEPAYDAGQDIVDWYSPVQGTPIKLVDLPTDRQEQIRPSLLKMANEIMQHVQELKNTGDNKRVLAGNILELALQYPDEECIYLVGEQPVLICWGFGPSTSGAKPQDLSRLGAFKPRPEHDVVPTTETPPQAKTVQADPPPAPPTVSEERPESPRSGRRFWLWLLVALLGLLLLLLLLWPESLNSLSQRLGSPVSLKWLLWAALGVLLCVLLYYFASSLRWLLFPLGIGLLLLLLWNLFGGQLKWPFSFSMPRLSEMFSSAPLAVPKAPAMPAGQPPSDPAGPLDAATQRGEELREERAALLAALADKAAECSQQPADNPVLPPVEEELQVPEDVQQGGHLDFIEGRWRGDSDLATPSDNVVVEYVFDALGKGTITVTTAHKTCSAPVSASIGEAGILLIESDTTIPCSSGAPIDGQRVECVGTGSSTRCTGLNVTSRQQWAARFVKF